MGWTQIGGEAGVTGTADIHVRIEPGKPKRIHALLKVNEEPLSYWTHWLNNVKRSVVCPGRSECPACKAQIPARMQHSMNVWDYAEKKVKVLSKGNQVYESVKMYYEMGGNSLDKVDIVIKQTGEGKDTKYVVASIAMTTPIPATIGPLHDLDVIFKKTDPQEIAKFMGEDVTSFPSGDVQADTGEFVMPTGKYKGQSLLHVVKTDRNYVEWVAENFEDEEIKEAAEEALLSTDRTAVEPKIAKVESVKDKKVKEALELIQSYQTKGGEIKAIAQIMRDVAKKTLLKDFTDIELDTFIEHVKDVIESLELEPTA